VRLYGTEEEPAERRRIAVGPLSVVLQAGALRAISWHGREAIRGIAFVVRDQNWGTCIPRITDLEIVESDEEIRVSYLAECVAGSQALGYAAVITVAANGSLEFAVNGAARSRFTTNRTGFTVLHPLDGVAGHPVTVTHTDGSVEEAVFPELISPSQPFFDIRALSHELTPGCRVTCVMEGDTYEMEDQRNWTDASFKTYVRPLSMPFPYALEAGEEFAQRVVLRIDGPAPAPAIAAADGRVALSIGDAALGRMPELGLAVRPNDVVAALELADRIRSTGIAWLTCTFDASAGHDAETMRRFRKLGEESGARLVLEAVLPLCDAAGRFTDDAAVLEADVDAIRRAAAEAGAGFDVVAPSPACYHKSWQPAGEWPAAPPLSAVYAAVRRAFPNARIAGGMHSYFTELNRCPPPIDLVDIVTHTTCPIVHAADDASVMQSLEALPWVFRTAQVLARGKPYWIGPTAIGMRFNPYGASPAPNPGSIRKAMVEVDPRQRGIFNAAWTLGFVARAVAGGVAGLCLSAPAGPFGIAWRPMGWDQPWFDAQASASAVFPVYHVIAGLAPRAGAVVRAVQWTDPTALAAIALETGEGVEVWMANLTPERRVVDLEGMRTRAVIERIDAETFESCCSGPNGLSTTAIVANPSTLALDAYAVLRVSPA
jgi:hypothetical protein